MSAVQGFGAELEVVVSHPPSPPPKRTRVRKGFVVGKGYGGREGDGFPSRCDWHSCIQGRGGRGMLVEAECQSLTSPPGPLPIPPPQRWLF